MPDSTRSLLAPKTVVECHCPSDGNVCRSCAEDILARSALCGRCRGRGEVPADRSKPNVVRSWLMCWKCMGTGRTR